MTIKSGRTKYSIVGISASDFPGEVQFLEKKSFQMDSNILKEMIIKTRFAVSTDETRYVLNGIYFTVNNGNALMVATDGKRLTYISRKEVIDKNCSLKCIIPSKAIEEILKIFSSMPDEPINIGIFYIFFSLII